MRRWKHSFQDRRYHRRLEVLTDPAGELRLPSSVLQRLAREDVVRLGGWMRAPSSWPTGGGALYGAAVLGYGSLVILTRAVPAVRDLNFFAWVSLAAILVTAGALAGLFAADWVSQWSRRQDDFRDYGVRCKQLIVFSGTRNPKSLATREALAMQVELVRRSASELHILIGPQLNRLDEILAKEKIDADDLTEVGRLGRAALLDLFQGKVDMPKTAPHLLRSFDKPLGQGAIAAVKKVAAFLVAAATIVPLLSYVQGL